MQEFLTYKPEENTNSRSLCLKTKIKCYQLNHVTEIFTNMHEFNFIHKNVFYSFMFALYNFKKYRFYNKLHWSFACRLCVYFFHSEYCKSIYNKQNIKRLREDMDLCSRVKKYLTRSLLSLVRYCFYHSNIKCISLPNRLISSIYVVHAHGLLEEHLFLFPFFFISN